MDFVPVIFRIEDEEYGIDINFVNGIEIVSDVYPAEIKSDNIKEKIDCRGKMIPVFSLRDKFAVKEQKHSKEPDKVCKHLSSKKDDNADDIRYIIVGIERIQFAIKADFVEKIDMDSEKKLYDIPRIIQSERTQCYDKILKVGERIVMILNVEKLLTTGEKNQIADGSF